MNNCIFITFNDKHFIYAEACFNSFAENYPDHPPIKVLYNGNDPGILAFLSKFPNVSVLENKIDFTQFEGLNLGTIGSPMVYVRLILWTNLFDEYDNVVYLDCDTLILKPFPEVLELQDFFCISDNIFTEQNGVFSFDKANDAGLLALLKQDNMEFSTANKFMINSGFFVLPKKYRTREHLNQIWQISNKYNNYILHVDQSVLSIWCNLNKIKISDDYRYNFQVQLLYTEAVRTIDFDSIKILHFAFFKPRGNFESLLSPANFVIKAHEAFCKYSSIDSK